MGVESFKQGHWATNLNKVGFEVCGTFVVQKQAPTQWSNGSEASVFVLLWHWHGHQSRAGTIYCKLNERNVPSSASKIRGSAQKLQQYFSYVLGCLPLQELSACSTQHVYLQLPVCILAWKVSNRFSCFQLFKSEPGSASATFLMLVMLSTVGSGGFNQLHHE